MKLTAIQIGILAGLIEQALKLFPREHRLMGKQPWESALEISVNSHPLLPSYEKLDVNLLETLIEHFTFNPECPTNTLEEIKEMFRNAGVNVVPDLAGATGVIDGKAVSARSWRSDGSIFDQKQITDVVRRHKMRRVAFTGGDCDPVVVQKYLDSSGNPASHMIVRFWFE